jgi:hypothetical protein
MQEIPALNLSESKSMRPDHIAIAQSFLDQEWQKHHNFKHWLLSNSQ